jgi:ABC-type nitrate/sulfonate/bicarbonate transport system permease component
VDAELTARLIDEVASPPSSPDARAPRGGRRRAAGARRRAADWLPRLAGIAAILVVLEICSRSGVVPRESFPPVSEIYGSLLNLVTDSPFWIEVGRTMRGWAVGLLLAVVLAVPIGMLVGASPRAFQMSRLIIEFLRPVPSVALIPLAVLVFGVGQDMKVFLVVFACFWPILFQSIYGVQDVDPVAVDTVRSYGLPLFARFTRVTLPSAAPYIATGVRISSAIALILALTAELVVGAPGLGRAIVVSQISGQITQMYALILATGLLGWLLNSVFQAVERRLLRWHPSHREVAL